MNLAVEYIRPVLFSPQVCKAAVISVYVISVLTIVGLTNIIFNGPGFANSILHLWKI